MSKKENTSFFSDEDWKCLLPGVAVKLGSKTIRIKPFGLEDFIVILNQLMSLQSVFEQEGINQKNFTSPEKIPRLTRVLMDNIPEVLGKATGIPTTDLRLLPVAKIIEIVNALLEVNLESQEGLEKNLQSLVGKLGKLVPTTQTIKKAR